MDAPKSDWCRIFIFGFVVMIVMIAGFSGIGSAQQTPNATTNTTMNTTTTAGGQNTPVANGTTTSIETPARSPTPVPDANDGWENATPVGTDRTANGTLPVGDQDWYVFPIESSGHITVRFVAGNQTNMSGFLYDSGGDLLASSYIAPGEQISLTGQATSAGDYYVFVRNEANDSPGTYAFSVSVDKSGTPDNESQLQPEADIETTNESGPGFGMVGGLVAIGGTGFLLFLARNSNRSKR